MLACKSLKAVGSKNQKLPALPIINNDYNSLVLDFSVVANQI